MGYVFSYTNAIKKEREEEKEGERKKERERGERGGQKQKTEQGRLTKR